MNKLISLVALMTILLVGIVSAWGWYSPSCTDSDGGLNYNVKGTVTYYGRSYTDYCVSNYVKEYYCRYNSVSYKYYKCSDGCQNGVCIQITSECGNDIIEYGEDCDDGSLNGNMCTPIYDSQCSYCDNDCKLQIVEGSYCGNNIIDIGYEDCDDGNSIDGDGCSSICENEINLWQSDSSIVSGLGDLGYITSPTIFQKDSTWYLISGENQGYYGFEWTGTTWQSYPNIVNGLVKVGFNPSPTVFQIGSTWYLISGDGFGDFTGYNWTGSMWINYPSIVEGLKTNGKYYTTPMVFYKDSIWYLISGNNNGGFFGFKLVGNVWQSYPSIVEGLDVGLIEGGIGFSTSPTIFQKDSIWYLISGDGYGSFYGYEWSNSINAWEQSSETVSGLTDIGTGSKPFVFQKDSLFYLISGEYYGVFTGWKMI